MRHSTDPSRARPPCPVDQGEPVRAAYDAVIFDIDGTLWNASAASAKGWNLALESMGLHQRVNPEQIASVAGYTYATCMDILLPGLRETHPRLFDIINDCETKAVTRDGGEFYPGALDGIIRLQNDRKIFLVSNCQEWYLRVFLDFSGLRAVVSGVDCHGMSGLRKEEMFSRMMREYSLGNPVYVGDTAGDEEAAALANIAFIHAAWGFGKPERGSKAVRSFAELVDRLTTATEGGGRSRIRCGRKRPPIPHLRRR